MVIEITLLISILSVSFSIFFGLKSNKRTDTKDIEERVKANTEINIKLDTVLTRINEIKDEVSDLKKTVNSHGESIIRLEASYKSEHRRIDGIEDRLNIKRTEVSHYE